MIIVGNKNKGNFFKIMNQINYLTKVQISLKHRGALKININTLETSNTFSVALIGTLDFFIVNLCISIEYIYHL